MKDSIRNILQGKKNELYAYFICSLSIFIMFGLMNSMKNFPFSKYFGAISPLLVSGSVMILGGLLFFAASFYSDFRFANKGLQHRGKFLLSPALIFTIIIVIADSADNFPRDTNVLLPYSLLFYPAIAFIVEIIFHLLPVVILASLLHFIKPRQPKALLLWGGLFCISLFEPAYQAVLSGTPLSIKNVYIFIHITLINIYGLFLFKKFDFITMYSFRLLYYSLWHIAWGTLRIYLLF